MEDKILNMLDTLKVDEDKAFEALPAIAVIIEKSEMIDYAEDLKVKAKEKGQKTLSSADGMKIMIRVVSRMKEYQEEVDEVLSLLFDVDVKSMNGKEKMALLKKILLDKDISSFF